MVVRTSKSLPGGGGVPHPDLARGVPHPDLAGGTPSWLGIPCPVVPVPGLGYPPSSQDWGMTPRKDLGPVTWERIWERTWDCGTHGKDLGPATWETAVPPPSPPPGVDGQSENITFPSTTYAAVKMTIF